MDNETSTDEVETDAVETGTPVAFQLAACTVIHEAPLDKSCENEAKQVAGVTLCAFSDLGEP